MYFDKKNIKENKKISSSFDLIVFFFFQKQPLFKRNRIKRKKKHNNPKQNVRERSYDLSIFGDSLCLSSLCDLVVCIFG